MRKSQINTVGVPGYLPGLPSAPAPGNCTTNTAHTYTSNPDQCSGAQGTEDADGRTRFSQPLSSLITLYQGERALIRLSDLDVTESQTLALMGLLMQLIGFQAKILRDEAGNSLPIYTNSINIGGGESVDMNLDSCVSRSATPPYSCNPGALIPKGPYFVYTSNLDHLSNDAVNFGGVMTAEEDVWPAAHSASSPYYRFYSA